MEIQNNTSIFRSVPVDSIQGENLQNWVVIQNNATLKVSPFGA
jgi:hypothetical protein